MKMKLRIIIACLLLLGSCRSQVTESYDKEISILIDQTDHMTVLPDGGRICASLGIDRDKYQGVRISISVINDRDFNPVESISLPAENSWFCNKVIREAKIAKFKNELDRKIASFVSNSSGSLPHSIIYRACAKQLEVLASRPAKYKALLVFSDLLENDQLSFYEPETFYTLKHKPSVIQKQLEQTMPLADLITINIFMVYGPVTYEENNRYLVTSGFFSKFFKSKHAWVHVEPSF